MIRLRLLGPVDLRDDLNGEFRRVLAQPKRLAILAYLAMSDGGIRRRDIMLAQFWPELDAARGRAALRQALYHLRRELGDSAVVTRTTEEVGINQAEVSSDVADFLAYVASGEDQSALALYRGDLLSGVYFADASPGWEAWLDAERTKLREVARTVARRRAAALEAAGDREGAASQARRAFELATEDEGAFRELITTLARLGDEVGVRKAHDAFVRRLEREYEMQPSDETEVLFAQLTSARERKFTVARKRAPGAREPQRAAAPLRRSLRRTTIIAATALALIGTGYFGLTRRDKSPAPVIAVGAIRNASGSPDAADAISELLTTQLARSKGAQVISAPRLYELAAQIDSSGHHPLRLSRAARAAGATEFIEGTVYPDSAGLRLELRRTDLVTGRALASGSVTGRDIFLVAERAGASVLGGDAGGAAPGTLRDVVTASVVALRFYQEGLRAQAHNDVSAARRFYSAAVHEDSAFAMAVFRLAQVTEDQVMFERALQLALNTSDRERLIISATIAHNQDDPARMQIADTLAVRYPTEPEGLLMLGRAQIAAGRFMDATVSLRRVIVMDSISLRATTGECRACAAYSELSTAYNFADSIAASERVAREFVRRAPQHVESWSALAGALQHAGRGDEGRAVVSRVESMAPRPFGELGARSDFLQREGRYAEAEAYLVRVMNAAHGDDLIDALWGHIIILRNQGRYREALAEADRMRTLDSRPPRPPQQFFWSAGMRALVLQDLGRFREAASLRDSIAHLPFGPTVSRRGRSQASELTHEATALMLAGDTARVHALVDSVHAYGELTGYELQRRMHHYVRGVYFRMIGRNEDAVRELRQSIYSPTVGFIRANYELGRALLATGRAREAVGVMESALRGSIGAGGLYATRTEMMYLLAQARDAAGDRAGAADAYANVASAWERGDASVQPRRSIAATRARQLTARL